MARAQDLEGYYRIPADTRDLNYDKFFVEGELDLSTIEDYTSHNTQRLDIAGVQSTLKNLSLIQGALKEASNQKASHG
jgi:UDP-glucose 4-epimerase